MKKRKIQSLSRKIVLSITLLSLFAIVVIFTVFEKINKEAFYNIELEKANIIARTIEPLIAINIYLGMHDKIQQISLQLIENPNILSVKVLINGETINEVKSTEYYSGIEDSFIINKTIYQPNSKTELGALIITYSSKNYKELIDKYTNLTLTLLFALGTIFALFSLYVKKLLSPLRKIAKSLKNYSPDREINIPYISQNNEIGLISNALNDMQKKILQYSNKQKNMNQLLEEKVNEKTVELRKQLYIDNLTGLPNRLSLINDIVGVQEGALLIINIDDFREINDFFGHIAGDNILKKFANRLLKMFQDTEYIELKRLSGDEFALLFMRKPSLEHLIQTAQKLIHDVEKMIFFYENNEIAIRITVGGVYEVNGAMEKADIALKSAKKQQKSFLLYDEKFNIEEQYKENMEWVKKLKKAMSQNKIVPHFQPIYDNKSNKIASYECLIRLIDDDENVISPYKFLTIAKKSRLYNKLTKLMIKKSCQFFENIDYDFSINLSVEDIIDSDIVEYIKQNIKKYNIGKKIIFEILESEGIENYEEISTFIDEMKALGCRVAIDDFGSGYSNFEHLLKLNIDYIKIDGTLIKNLDLDKNAQVVVETIVDFAKRLNILTVAEFVHNEAISIKVKELNISRSQGFYLAKPEEKLKHD